MGARCGIHERAGPWPRHLHGTELACAYLTPPSLNLAASGGVAPSGAVAHPFFFSGSVEHPAVVAQALLVLASVARTRFHVPPIWW